MKRFALPFILILILTACAPSQVSTALPTPQPFDQAQDKPATVSPTEVAPTSESDANSSSELTRFDEQGAVTVEVTPLNLDIPADNLEFDVAMNTHSVDLSMDLATLAVLSTDTGVTIQAVKWDATPGGHHVEGKLIFAAEKDGTSVLEGAGKLMLTITNLDAPTRAFEWELN
jgi:hypothetical protein